jgi:hypothetical protein
MPQDRQVGVNSGEGFSFFELTLMMGWNMLVLVGLD